MDKTARPRMEDSSEKGFSFSKEDRLLKPEEFSKARKRGRRVSTRSFVLYVMPNGLGRARLGLSVSAKAGNAVTRNRIKRLVREFFRLNRSLFPEGADILVTARDIKAVKGLKDVEDEFRGAFGPAGPGKNV